MDLWYYIVPHISLRKVYLSEEVGIMYYAQQLRIDKIKWINFMLHGKLICSRLIKTLVLISL